MAFIPATWIVEAVMKYTLDGQEVRNVFHIDPHESPNTGLLETIAETMAVWWAAEIAPSVSSDLVLYEVECKDLSSESGSKASYTPVPPTPGDSATDASPNNVAVCVSFKTLLSGRSYQGRTYLPGIPDNVMTNSHIDTAWAINLLDSFDTLLTTLATAGWDLVVTSFFNGGAPRSSAVSTIITDLVINLVSDSMRRRLPGRGE